MTKIQSNNNKEFFLSSIIESTKIKRFFPIYGITAAGTCACNRSDCRNAGKHPKVLWTDEKNRSFLPLDCSQAIATGWGLVVVDCDIRDYANGWLSLINLAKKHGGVPETVTVNSGGGGKHLYFRTDKKFKNLVRFEEGLDLRAEKGSAIFPKSKHTSGGIYEFDPDLHPDLVPVAELPIWLEKLFEIDTSSSLNSNKNNTYDAFYVSDAEWQTIKEALGMISSDCDRDFWRKIGMCLFNSGREDAFEVWDSWSKKSAHIRRNNKSIYSRKETEYQWITQFEYSPINLPLEIIEIAKIAPPPEDPMLKFIKDKFLLPKNSLDFERTKEDETIINEESADIYMNEAIEKSEGFVKDYYNFATSHSRYSINKLHFLAAFSAISAVAQSSFLSPTRCSLALYQIGFANTGRGKDDVLFYLKDILSRVDKSIISNGKYTSLNGLLLDLYEFNSKIQIMDEVHSYLTPMLKALPSSPLFPIPGLLMELWGHRDSIAGVSSRALKIPEIKQPKLSFYSMSSFAGMRYFKDQQAISSGFLNRFLVAIAKESPKVSHDSFREPMPESFVEFLKRIFIVSENEESKELKINFEEEIKEHVPQRIVKKIMGWEDDLAKKYFEEMVERIDEKREILSNSGSHDEHDMYSRYAEQIIRLASLHALGREKSCVALSDLKIAEKMLFTLAIDMLEFLDIDLKESQFFQYKKKILAFYKTKRRTQKEASLREITQLLCCKTQTAEETLDELVAQNIFKKKQSYNKNNTVTKSYILL